MIERVFTKLCYTIRQFNFRDFFVSLKRMCTNRCNSGCDFNFCNFISGFRNSY